MNRVEPALVPGCFKMFNTTVVNREEPGRMSNTGVNRGDTGSYRERPWLHRVSTVINRVRNSPLSCSKIGVYTGVHFFLFFFNGIAEGGTRSAAVSSSDDGSSTSTAFLAVFFSLRQIFYQDTPGPHFWRVFSWKTLLLN